MGVLLVPAERGVAALGPPPRVVGVAVGAADVVETLHGGVDVFGEEVEVLHLVHDAGVPALLGCAVVGHHHEDGVVEQAALAQALYQATDLVVGVVEEGGERLLQPRGEPTLVVGELVPRLHPGVAGGQPGVGRDDPLVHLAAEPALAHHVPALVVAAAVLGQVRGRGLVRGVGGAEGHVGEERAVGAHRGAVGDHLEELVDQVLAHVVAVFGPTGWLDVVVVAHQVGVELVGLALQEPVEAVEATTEGPLVERAGGGALLHGRQVPLAHAEGGVALLAEHLGHGGGVVRDVAELVGEPGAEVGERPHAHGVLGPAGEQRRPGGRTERGDVEVGELHAAGRQGVDVGGVDV